MGIAAGVLLGAYFAACSPDGILGNVQLPTNVSDPAATHTPAGALMVYNGALAQFREAFAGSSASFVDVGGELTDELQDANIGSSGGIRAGTAMLLDARSLTELQGVGSAQDESDIRYPAVYASLQRVRGQASEALGLLRDYPPANSPALRGHVFALQAYSEVMLAELYCSGIPLSTVDYNGSYTLKPGSTTTEVLAHASALFDSALALAGDSASVLNLARVGKGRALLDLDSVSAAAQAVADVPDDFRYEVGYSATTSVNGLLQSNFARLPDTGFFWLWTVGDGEGGNGLPYVSSGDPRTASSMMGTNQFGVALHHPDKYAGDGSSPVVLADGVEARLIQAEAALRTDDPSWLTTVNALRETAITPALPDTADPGSHEARVDLLFRERAFWLFLTGHREGDLRRLIRQYGRTSQQVYPTGGYPVSGVFYGNDVNAPIPPEERQRNPEFAGCTSRGA